MSDSKEHKFKVGDKVVPFPTEDGWLSDYLVAGSTYAVTEIYENGRVDVEGTFKSGGNGNDWDSDWFKPYEEKEVKVEKTCEFKVGDVVVCTETDSSALEGNFLSQGQSYLVSGIDAYDKFEDSFLLKVENIETQQTTYAYEYRFNQKKETSVTAESLRNSVLSLQQERVSLQEKIEQNIAQEKSLTEQLKELGFLLVESKQQPTNVVDEKKSVLYAEDIEEDMTNYRNWEHGDVLEVITHDDPMVPFGTLVKHNDRDGDGSPYTKSEYSSKWAIDGEYLKFHSRPVVN